MSTDHIRVRTRRPRQGFVAATQDIGAGRLAVSVTCDRTGTVQRVDRMDPRLGYHCSHPDCVCLAESKATLDAVSTLLGEGSDILRSFGALMQRRT